MTIETGLRTHLLADGPVAALVVARVYPLHPPQSPTYPCLSYEIVSDIPYRRLAGDDNRERIRVRVDCWAATYVGAVDLAGKVRTAVADFSGLMGTTPVSSVKFESWTDIFEDVPEVYRRVVDFMITHT